MASISSRSLRVRKLSLQARRIRLVGDDLLAELPDPLGRLLGQDVAAARELPLPHEFSRAGYLDALRRAFVGLEFRHDVPFSFTWRSGRAPPLPSSGGAPPPRHRFARRSWRPPPRRLRGAARGS